MWPSLDGRRFAVQIFGREPAALARAAEMAVDVGASIVDINMGCPAKKVTAGMCGSALMREPELAASLVDAVRRAVPAPIPVTVKHRTGWDESSINAAEFAQRLVDVGAAMITVHGRTRSQGFSGQAQLAPIAAVRAALPAYIPVVGNGDVKDVGGVPAHEGGDGMRRRDDRPRRHGQSVAVSIAGGTVARRVRPRSAHPGRETPRLATARRPVHDHAHEKMRVHELRKTLAWYSRGLWGGSQLRQKSGSTSDPVALLDLGESFFARLGVTGADRVASDAVAKSVARHLRKDGSHVEAQERAAC